MEEINKEHKILLEEDIIKISQFLFDNHYDNMGLCVSMKLPDKVLNRLNLDFFYKNSDNQSEKPDHVDEINVSSNGVDFRFTIDEDANI